MYWNILLTQLPSTKAQTLANMSLSQLQNSEREMPQCGGTNQHAVTKNPCNQPAITVLTHSQPQCTTNTAANNMT